jgi:hypothetical protein
MKRLILMIALIISSLPLLVAAQQWDSGLSIGFGKDYFDRSYLSEYDKYPYLRRDFQSNYSWVQEFGRKDIQTAQAAIGANYV